MNIQSCTISASPRLVSNVFDISAFFAFIPHGGDQHDIELFRSPSNLVKQVIIAFDTMLSI